MVIDFSTDCGFNSLAASSKFLLKAALDYLDIFVSQMLKRQMTKTLRRFKPNIKTYKGELFHDAFVIRNILIRVK